MLKNLYLITGRSGSGKTSVARLLQQRYGYTPVLTCTTRPRRFPGEDTYYFVTPEEFDSLDGAMAVNTFAGHRYGLTGAALNDGDLCILEPKGILDIKRLYRGRPVKVIGLHAPATVLEERMRARGDSEEDIKKRLENDTEAFHTMDDICDIVVHNRDLYEAVSIIEQYILLCEDEEPHCWVLTDDDCLQYRRRCINVDGPVYELVQAVRFADEGSGEFFKVAHGYIYLADYEAEEIKSSLDSYGLDPFETDNSIIAECLFEDTALECLEETEYPTLEAAASRIEKIIGRPVCVEL